MESFNNDSVGDKHIYSLLISFYCHREIAITANVIEGLLFVELSVRRQYRGQELGLSCVKI